MSKKTQKLQKFVNIEKNPSPLKIYNDIYIMIMIENYYRFEEAVGLKFGCLLNKNLFSCSDVEYQNILKTQFLLL